ncbi:MAG: GTP-binding protein, partial [Halobacteriota archaeon]
MPPAELVELVEGGERDNIEFKERLERETHLDRGRLESLAAQMRHRVLTGNGVGVYVVGVSDDGGLVGVDDDAFEETLSVLGAVAGEADVAIADVERYDVDGGSVGVVTVSDSYGEVEHLVVGTAGHVDHGKSTLVGALVTGEPDDGDGGTRTYLDVQPHEVERGLSADISYGVYGFDGDAVIRTDNPLSKREKSDVVRDADRLVSFVDTVGHEPWLKTTIRGIVGQKLDYGLVTVAADDGPTRVTREHLGILFATDLPCIVAVTKTDVVSDERVREVEREVSELLKSVGRIPHRVDSHGVDSAVERLPEGVVVPVVRTSAVTLEGYDVLDEFFRRLPKTQDSPEDPFELYVDRTYQVTGVGAVASGTVKSGSIEAGDTVYLGPYHDGGYREVEARSIEMHYHRVDRAETGNIVGIALKGVDGDDVERGMVLSSEEPPAVREFEAEVMVLNHPTRIR